MRLECQSLSARRRIAPPAFPAGARLLLVFLLALFSHWVALAQTATAAATNTATNVVAATTNAPTGPTFEVDKFEVIGNTRLWPEDIALILTNATGPKVTFEQIRQALGELQLAYRARGYATVAVSLPQQQITNGIVIVKVTEGKLVDIRVAGNRYFSDANVRRALPSLQTNILLNSHVFQRELDLANRNRDRQIYPTLTPGPEPETTALKLQVKDRLPVHGRFDLDNYASPGTPELRVNAAAQYNNLWQREHQIGLSYGFTPQELKTPGVVPSYYFNAPLVSYYGAFYRLPLAGPDAIGEEVSQSADFGYDEATRQFRMPPAGGQPDFTVYASGSSSDSGLKTTPRVLVAETALLKIESFDTGQDVTINEMVGARASAPLTRGEGLRLGISGGADFKRYKLDSYNTNNFLVTTTITNQQGSQTIETLVASPQPVRKDEVNYAPLALGLDFFAPDKFGTTSVSLNGAFNFAGDSTNFAQAAYSHQAQAVFAKLNYAVTRDQTIFGKWSLLARASGQVATGPLINNEQFPLGGVNSVRGYYEGEQYGDSGWFTSLELRTPLIPTRISSFNYYVPTWLRASIFMDYGQVYLIASGVKTQPTPLWGTGFGLSGNINNHVDVRVAVGWPLETTYLTETGSPRAYFTIGGQF